MQQIACVAGEEEAGMDNLELPGKDKLVRFLKNKRRELDGEGEEQWTRGGQQS